MTDRERVIAARLDMLAQGDFELALAEAYDAGLAAGRLAGAEQERVAVVSYLKRLDTPEARMDAHDVEAGMHRPDPAGVVTAPSPPRRQTEATMRERELVQCRARWIWRCFLPRGHKGDHIDWTGRPW